MTGQSVLHLDGPCPACGQPRVRVATCLCSHSVSSHRIDLARRKCERPGCGCTEFREAPPKPVAPCVLLGPDDAALVIDALMVAADVHHLPARAEQYRRIASQLGNALYPSPERTPPA